MRCHCLEHRDSCDHRLRHQSQFTSNHSRKQQIWDCFLSFLVCLGSHSYFVLAGTPRSEVQEEVECAPSPHLSLTLKVRPPHTPVQFRRMRSYVRLRPQVAGLGTTREVELPLSNYKSTIFFYVQRLLQLSCSGAVKTDKLRRIWEPTYT